MPLTRGRLVGHVQDSVVAHHLLVRSWRCEDAAEGAGEHGTVHNASTMGEVDSEEGQGSEGRVGVLCEGVKERERECCEGGVL